MAVLSRFAAAGAVVVFCLVLGTSCGKDPAAPSGPPVGGIPTTSLVMVGPETVAPGATGQFNVTGHRSDGTTVDSTNQVVWSSSRPFIAAVSSTGVVTGRANGDATITAAFGTVRATREVIVVPTGTFRVVGRVNEPIGPATFPVPGASIQTLSGQLSGSTLAFADSDGRYRLYGVAGEIDLRARKTAYRDHVQRVIVTDHQTVDFELTTTLPFNELEGSYSLTITAASSCAQALPEAARVRTYAASIVRSGRLLNVVLGGATFVGSSNRFTGRIEPTFTSFNLYSSFYYYYYYSPIIIEQLEPDRRLSIGGFVTGLPSGDRFSTTFGGSIRLASDRNVQVATCNGTHRFELRR